MASCIVLGAGLAGLTAATFLQEAGYEVTVVDKGRGVGGRMATRRLGEGGRADHGAQFYSVRSAEWTKWNDTWLSEGVVSPWFYKSEHPRLIAHAGMSSIPKKLAAQLTVITQERIVNIEYHAGQYTAFSESGRSWVADTLVLTFPAPQALTLLESSQLGIPHQEVLKSIEYAPCITVMAVLDRSTLLPSPGGMEPPTGPIGWIADNLQKGISPIPTVTIQATPAYSAANFERPLDDVKAELLSSAAPWLGQATCIESAIHRWRYSLATQKREESFFTHPELPGLYLGGDGFGEGHVEAAFLSGFRIAQDMIGK